MEEWLMDGCEVNRMKGLMMDGCEVDRREVR